MRQCHQLDDKLLKKKNSKGNFMLKVPQPFSLQKIICISICIRNRGNSFFFLFSKKIFSIKKIEINVNNIYCFHDGVVFVFFGVGIKK